MSVDVANSLIARSVCLLGPLNVMIANAAITQVKGLLDLTGHDMRTMFNVNLFGVYNCYAAAARQFIEQGGGDKNLGAARYVYLLFDEILSFYLLLPFLNIAREAISAVPLKQCQIRRRR